MTIVCVPSAASTSTACTALGTGGVDEDPLGMFRLLHAQLDELADDARGWADRVAERLVALGVPSDGRVETVAESTPLASFPAGFVEDGTLVATGGSSSDSFVGGGGDFFEQAARTRLRPVSRERNVRSSWARRTWSTRTRSLRCSNGS